MRFFYELLSTTVLRLTSVINRSFLRNIQTRFLPNGMVKVTGRTIFMWEPNLSPHKLGLYHALKVHPDVARVVYVAQEGVPIDRRSQGWSVATKDDDEIIFGPEKAYAHAIVEAAPIDAVHVFSGMRSVPTIVYGLNAVLSLNRRFALMSEPRAFDGVGGVARLVHSWLTEGRLRAKASFVLAIGANGPSWFRMSGYRNEIIFPYAYFLNVGAIPPTRPRKNPVAVGFLGRLESSKGLTILLEALSLVNTEIELFIAGSGRLESNVRAMAAGTDNFHYVGVLPIDQVPQFLEGVDILVQPSIVKDGWGAVIGEALFAGAAVVTTKRVGASICIEGVTGLGTVVSKLDASEIATAIDDIAQSSALDASSRARRMVWSRERLSGTAGAEHLIRILQHILADASRPRPFYLSPEG